MKELIIVRHGEADHMVTDLTGGWTDSHLTELGVRQAHLTGQRLRRLTESKDIKFYSSDQPRAAETSSIISQHLEVYPVLVHELRELNNGAGANLNHQDASEIAIPITTPLVDWTPYPGAESWRMMSVRVNASWKASVRSRRQLCLLCTVDLGMLLFAGGWDWVSGRPILPSIWNPAASAGLLSTPGEKVPYTNSTTPST